MTDLFLYNWGSKDEPVDMTAEGITDLAGCEIENSYLLLTGDCSSLGYLRNESPEGIIEIYVSGETLIDGFSMQGAKNLNVSLQEGAKLTVKMCIRDSLERRYKEYGADH